MLWYYEFNTKTSRYYNYYKYYSPNFKFAYTNDGESDGFSHNEIKIDNSYSVYYKGFMHITCRPKL